MFEQQERMLFNNELFIERLKLARKAMGASLNDIIKYSSVDGEPIISKSALSLWERGKRTPTLDTIIIVANTLGVLLDWLVGHSEEIFSENVISRLEPKSFPVVLMLDNAKIELPVNIPEDYIDEELRKSAYTLELRARINYLLLAIQKEYEDKQTIDNRKIKEYLCILQNIFENKAIITPNKSQKIQEEIVDSLGSKLKALRKERGLTIYDMITLSTHFKKSSVSGWEKGSSIPSAIVIAEYARVFDVSTDWILGLTDEKEP